MYKTETGETKALFITLPSVLYVPPNPAKSREYELAVRPFGNYSVDVAVVSNGRTYLPQTVKFTTRPTGKLFDFIRFMNLTNSFFLFRTAVIRRSYYRRSGSEWRKSQIESRVRRIRSDSKILAYHYAGGESQVCGYQLGHGRGEIT